MPPPPRRQSFSRTGEHTVTPAISLALLFVELINQHDVPWAARATIRGDLITEWHIYADNEPVRAILRRESM